MASEQQVKKGKSTYFSRFRKRWFRTRSWANWFDSYTTWDGWILGAYRDRIDYSSFLESHNKNQPITDAEKEKVLKNNRQDILDAIKTNKQENPYKKTFLHYMGKTCVYLLAISSAFTLSGMVTAHLPIAGRLANELTAWAFFMASYLAHLVIFRKSVPRVAENLLYVGKENDGANKGWHFLKKYELVVRYENNAVVTEYYNTDKKSYESTSEHNTFSPGEKVVGIVLLFFITIVAAFTATLSVTKAIPSMEGMQLLSLMSLGPTFLPLGYILACAGFVCSLGLLLNSVIKLLKQEDKLKEFRKLFYWGDSPGISLTKKWATNGLTVLVMIVVFGLVGLGMYGSSRVEAEDFMVLIHSTQAMAAMATVLACAMVGKLIFTVRATVNLLLLGGRALNVCGTWMWHGVKSIFSSTPPAPLSDTALQVCSNSSSDRHKWYEDGAVAVNALSQPAKTTQPPSHSEHIDDLDLDPSDDTVSGGSPFIEGSFWGLTYVWATGLGATLRSGAAAFNELKTHTPDIRHESAKNLAPQQ